MKNKLKTAQINLFVFDEKENFYNQATQNDIGIGAYRSVCLIENLDDFESQLFNLNDDDLVFMIVHAFHSEKIKGYRKYLGSGIETKYPNIKPCTKVVSSGSKRILLDELEALGKSDVMPMPYYKIMDTLNQNNGDFFARTKKEILGVEDDESVYVTASNVNSDKYPQIDYAIITALYKDEFEQVRPHFNWPKNEEIHTGTKAYKVGYLKTDKKIKVVAAIPSATGMVDSAIIATQMLDFFRPKYLIMSGVCGGNSSTKFGDIVIGSSIFTFQKGKISSVKSADGKQLELYDRSQNIVDYEHLYDSDGNQVAVSIEKFEVEHDSIMELDSLTKDKIEPHLEEIEQEINKILSPFGKSINIHLDPIACSTMVINKEGYFKDTIKVIQRKTVAVEMESYGVARACKFANDGKTKFLIFKSVMDNTVQKNDEAKKLAAFTSAAFLNQLFVKGII